MNTTDLLRLREVAELELREATDVEVRIPIMNRIKLLSMNIEENEPKVKPFNAEEHGRYMRSVIADEYELNL